MFELSEEEIIMQSADGSIQLTTHRLIQETDEGRNQIMLEDYESAEIVTANIGNYKALTVIFSILLSGAIILSISNYLKQRNLFNKINWGSTNDELKQFLEPSFSNTLLENPFFYVFLFLLIVSILFYLMAKRQYINLHGKYNTITFRLNNMRKQSIDHFLETLKRQSGIAKDKLVREI